jgi:o-succinylbenzoate---CoA ligase
MAELVALRGQPGPPWVAQLRRWWDRGDAVLPVDDRLPAPAVAALYDAVRPTVIASVDGSSRHHPGRSSEPGDALVLATSGTTGAPKGVVLTHEAVTAAGIATSTALAVDPSVDTWLCCLPLAHAGGLGVVTRSLVTGTPVVVLPGFDAEAVTEAATRIAGRVLVSLVATTLGRVDPGLFRVVLLGGDAPPSWPDGRPGPVVVTYGMTETGGGCVYDGVPVGQVEVVVDPQGEVRVRGPVLGRAYRGPEGDEPLVGADGWFATGDGGRIEADGRLVVDGRLGEVIVTGGEKVWPAAVEAVLSRCAGVGSVAVVGRADPEWGEQVVAVVVPDAGAAPRLADLRAAVKDELGAWAAPRALDLVEALPRTALGKIRRSALH